jgi:hypothetical protein
MLKLYKRIWADAISYEQNKKGRETGWQALLLISMSVLEGLNLLTILFIIRWLTHDRMPILLPVTLLNARMFDIFISVVCTFFIPFAIINYLLVFYADRYKVLLNSYKPENGKLYRRYAMITIAIIVIPFIFRLIF